MIGRDCQTTSLRLLITCFLHLPTTGNECENRPVTSHNYLSLTYWLECAEPYDYAHVKHESYTGSTYWWTILTWITCPSASLSHLSNHCDAVPFVPVHTTAYTYPHDSSQWCRTRSKELMRAASIARTCYYNTVKYIFIIVFVT